MGVGVPCCGVGVGVGVAVGVGVGVGVGVAVGVGVSVVIVQLVASHVVPVCKHAVSTHLDVVVLQVWSVGHSALVAQVAPQVVVVPIENVSLHAAAAAFG